MEKLENVINQLLVYVQNAEFLLLKETPLFIQELIAFEVYSLKFLIVITLVVFLLMATIKFFVLRLDGCDFNSSKAVVSTLTVLLLVWVVVAVPTWFLKFKKTEIAPKLFIVDYLANKLNSGVKK